MTSQVGEWRRVCEALVIATQYLGADRNDEEYTEEDDLKIIEHVADLLTRATPMERAGLIAASNDIGLHDWARHMGIE